MLPVVSRDLVAGNLVNSIWIHSTVVKSISLVLHLRAHVLLVSCGFSLLLELKYISFTQHFITSHHIGFLPQSATTAVAEQWEVISSILKDMETLPFDLHLEERTKEGWYEKAMKIIEKERIGDSISLYAEDDGISALLSFSKLSILAAQSSEGVEKDDLLKLSFSVLLPVVRWIKRLYFLYFCLCI